MSSLAADKLREIIMRLDVLERIVTSPTVSRREMKTIIAALIVIAVVACAGVAGEIYVISRIDKIYSLLESL